MKLLKLALGTTLVTFGCLSIETKGWASACLAEADALYVQNDRTAAEKRYRECKQPFPEEKTKKTFFPTPIADATQLSPRAQTLWKKAQADNDAAILPLQQLNRQHPEFTPAYINLAQALQANKQKDEALELLEQAAIRFPSEANIAKARIRALRASGDRLDASIAARLFTIVNPKHPETKQFKELADKHLRSFKSRIKAKYIANSVGVTACKFLLPFLCRSSNKQKITETIQIARMIIEGESGMGKRMARTIIENNKKKGKLVEDPVINSYVNRIGKDIAALMGRDEFKYEFYVINDPTIEAFALPGGKVFIHTGALLAANSEAELAGLVGHEVAHTVLSHGYRSLTRKTFLDSLSKSAPGGNLAKLGITFLNRGMSRKQERNSDILATRALAGYGYAADGLHNFFVTLNNQTSSRRKTPEYLSTHPATTTRLSYLRAIIKENGYNRYSYEGVKEHKRIKQRLQKLLGR